MSQPGKASFTGSPFFFWTLGPVFFVCALMFGLFTYGSVRAGDVQKAAIGATLTITLLCGILMLFNPTRFRWAGRVVTAAIFGAYLAYAIHEWFFTTHAFRWSESRSESSPRNALLGLLVIGGPCLWFTLFGRLSLVKERERVPRPGPKGRSKVKVLGSAPRAGRPFTDHERELLQDSRVFPSPNLGRALAIASGWLILGLASLTGFLWVASRWDNGPSWMPKVGGLLFIVPILSLYAAYATLRSYWALRDGAKRYARVHSPRVQAALVGGEASVVAVEALSVIEIEEEQEEGAAWLFALEDGTTLYLRGGDYFPAEEEMPWPAKRFEIVRAAANDQWIGLFSKGPELEPDLTVQSDEMPDDFVWAEDPASESVLAGSPTENLRKLGYEPERE